MLQFHSLQCRRGRRCLGDRCPKVHLQLGRPCQRGLHRQMEPALQNKVHLVNRLLNLMGVLADGGKGPRTLFCFLMGLDRWTGWAPVGCPSHPCPDPLYRTDLVHRLLEQIEALVAGRKGPRTLFWAGWDGWRGWTPVGCPSRPGPVPLRSPRRDLLQGDLDRCHPCFHRHRW